MTEYVPYKDPSTCFNFSFIAIKQFRALIQQMIDGVDELSAEEKLRIVEDLKELQFVLNVVDECFTKQALSKN